VNSDQPLNILGFSPLTLNVLLELADITTNIQKFNIFENIPCETKSPFVPLNRYDLNFINCYEGTFQIEKNEQYVLGVVGRKSKKIVHDFFKERIGMKNDRFINLVHPSSEISISSSLNHGIQIEQLTSISALAKVGFGVNIRSNCSIGHHTTIGDYVTINPGVTISGRVKIGNNTQIGAGTVIRDHVKIGSNCVIGMGSNVVADIPDNSIAYGNPCKIKGFNKT
jgi:sugar O-acyltransferase (sialic acid O-acetyltransferase NeuD family)